MSENFTFLLSENCLSFSFPPFVCKIHMPLTTLSFMAWREKCVLIASPPPFRQDCRVCTWQHFAVIRQKLKLANFLRWRHGEHPCKPITTVPLSHSRGKPKRKGIELRWWMRHRHAQTTVFPETTFCTDEQKFSSNCHFFQQQYFPPIFSQPPRAEMWFLEQDLEMRHLLRFQLTTDVPVDLQGIILFTFTFTGPVSLGLNWWLVEM